jgi:hypothetical protein
MRDDQRRLAEQESRPVEAGEESDELSDLLGEIITLSNLLSELNHQADVISSTQEPLSEQDKMDLAELQGRIAITEGDLTQAYINFYLTWLRQASTNEESLLRLRSAVLVNPRLTLAPIRSTLLTRIATAIPDLEGAYNQVISGDRDFPIFLELWKDRISRDGHLDETEKQKLLARIEVLLPMSVS